MNKRHFDWDRNTEFAKSQAEQYAHILRLHYPDWEIHVWQDPIHKQTTVEWEIKR